MQKSMTGFGKAETEIAGKKFCVEVRSLNSKQLDLSIRMPQAYRSMENDIRAVVSKALVRGKVEVSLSVTTTATETLAHIDNATFKAYVEQIDSALTEADITASHDTVVQLAMKMPNVIQSEVTDASDEEQGAVMAAVEAAVAKIDEFRKQEGAILIADLLRRVDLIEQMRNEIIPFEAARTEAVRQRIREGIEKLGVEVDNNRLEQEMIFYIEKLDITEEKVRLENHCKYFREVANNEEQAGRKLGFIAQEMGREINTTGSKANQHDIQKLVVKMKDELEKIKEQVLNIL